MIINLPVRKASAHRDRDGGLGHDDFRLALGDFGGHLLLLGDRQGTFAFGVGSGDRGIGLGLIGLQPGADVGPHVDVSDVDRDDFKSGLRIELLSQHGFGNHVGVFEHRFVAVGRPDRRDDAPPRPAR